MAARSINKINWLMNFVLFSVKKVDLLYHPGQIYKDNMSL
jgi:hypothetical protein